MIEYLENGDLAVIDGLKYRLDKKTGYYHNTVRRERLHRYVWEKEHGNIPPGYDIHHIDGNKKNNDISNLMMISRSDHASLHGKNLNEEERTKRRDNIVNNAMPKAVAWHKSQSGHEWHMKHYEGMKEKLHSKKEYICECCGKTYVANASSQNRFCSNSCKAMARRRSGIDNEKRICLCCGNEFETNKYAARKYCSAECRSKMRPSKKHSA